MAMHQACARSVHKACCENTDLGASKQQSSTHVNKSQSSKQANTHAHTDRTHANVTLKRQNETRRAKATEPNTHAHIHQPTSIPFTNTNENVQTKKNICLLVVVEGGRISHTLSHYIQGCVVVVQRDF
eukprot:m.38966 g.38966  ORF g.38966 m.38966 type:complete len:128 (+) comp11719_c0_seq1:123-506(+)